MRILLFGLIAYIGVSQARGIHASHTCAGAEKICAGVSFPASTTSQDIPPASNCYGVVSSQPNPAWFVFEVAPGAPETVQLTISASEDIDHVLWGPFASVEEAHSNCGSLKCASESPGIVDDDFSGSPVTKAEVNIPNAHEGNVYILLVTNYGGAAVDIHIDLQDNSEGAISCAGVPGVKGMGPEIKDAYCNQNWYPGDYDTGTNSYTVEQCKKDCLDNPNCSGISFSAPESNRCVKCTNEMSHGSHTNWVVYHKLDVTDGYTLHSIEGYDMVAIQGYQSDLERLFAEALGLDASAVSSTLTQQQDGTIKIDLIVTGPDSKLDAINHDDFLTNLGAKIIAVNRDLAEALGFIDSSVTYGMGPEMKGTYCNQNWHPGDYDNGINGKNVEQCKKDCLDDPNCTGIAFSNHVNRCVKCTNEMSHGKHPTWVAYDKRKLDGNDECAQVTHNCNENAECTNTDAGFTCACKAGYQGDGINCQDINECAQGTDNCNENSDCTNTDGGFTCACKDGYRGDGVDICQDINECTDGTHTCDIHADCKNTEGGVTCTCKAGFVGDGETCNDVNECAQGTDSCSGNADCTNTDGGFTCACKAGYEGDGVNCQDSNECAAKETNNCHTNAVCTNTDGGFTCACKSGYQGDGIHCRDSNECAAQKNE